MKDVGNGLRSLGQLWWSMLLEWVRDGMIAYVAMPFVIIGGLGLAFGERKPEPVRVAMVEGADAAHWEERLAGEKELKIVRVDLAEAERQLQIGRVALVIEPGDPPSLIVDPTQAEGRLAKLAVEKAFGEARAGATAPDLHERTIDTAGRRYVDFLVPGFLAYMLLGAAVNGVGQTLVQDRQRRLLKRYAATPMRRWHYLVSHGLLGLSIALITVPLYYLAGRLMFSVKMLGNPFALALFAVYGMMMLSGLGFLLGSRAERTEQTHTLTTLISIPLTLAGGAFFSLERFPDWSQPILRSLPLTAFVDGLRGIMTGKAGLLDLGRPTLVLAIWGLGTMAIALKIFRWK